MRRKPIALFLTIAMLASVTAPMSVSAAEAEGASPSTAPQVTAAEAGPPATAPTAAAEPDYIDYTEVADKETMDGLGNYGKRLVIEGNSLAIFNPQYPIYRILEAWFKDQEVNGVYTPKQGENVIAVTWEATPLAYNLDFLMEGVEAFALDHPQYNLNEYDVERFESIFVTNYVSRMKLVLKKRAYTPSRDYQTQFKAACDAVDAVVAVDKASGDYQKAMAAVDWLLNNNNCTFDSAAYGSNRFVTRPLGTSFGANGVFAFGKASSPGYAAAFQLLMNHAGIPCAVGRGAQDVWAYVQLDGKWYVMDIGGAARNGGNLSYLFRDGSGYIETSPVGTMMMKRLALGSGVKVANQCYQPVGETTVVSIVQPEHGTITVKSNGAELTSGDAVQVGSDLTVSVEPDQGFELYQPLPKNLYDYGSKSGEYILHNLRQPMTVDAEIKENPNQGVLPPISLALEVEVEGQSGADLQPGMLSVMIWPEDPLNDTPIYKQTPDRELRMGENLIPAFPFITVQPIANPGYEFVSVEVSESGSSYSLTPDDYDTELNPENGEPFNGFYLLGRPYGNTTITGIFRPISSAAITSTHTGAGNIIIKDVTQNNLVVSDGVTVHLGDQLEVSVLPDSGHQIKSFKVNNVETPLTQGIYKVTVKEDLAFHADFTPVDDSSDGNGDGGSGGNSGGSSGGGGGGGGSSSVETPAGDSATEGKTAVGTIDSGAVEKQVDQAVLSGENEVVIKPEFKKEEQSANQAQVELPAKLVKQMADKSNVDLRLELPNANVTLPSKALNGLTSKGDQNVAVKVTRAEGSVFKLEVTAGGRTVDQLAGGAKLAVPGKEYGPGSVAVLLESDGTEKLIRKSAVIDGTMEIPLNGSASVKIENRGLGFDDTGNHWSKNAVTFVTARGLFSGISSDSFAPDQKMNRGMLATVLYRLEDMPTTSYKNGFADVADPASYYYNGVIWAAEKGIVSGTGTGFAPNEPVTREQLAVILCAYMEQSGQDVTDSANKVTGPASLDGFSDKAEVSAWAEDAVRWAVAQGLLKGKDGGRLDPQGEASRGEVAALMERMVDAMAR